MEKAQNSPVLKISGDGSHTLYRPDLDEHYHSTFGALAESMHIFIRAGLIPLLTKLPQINILEIGFGTGLNALLTLITSSEYHKKIDYSALELYPLTEDIWSKLNYADFIDKPGINRILNALHTAEWGRTLSLTSEFSLCKIKEDLLNWKAENSCFDLVFFDAFAPDKQPELWTWDVFRRLSDCMHEGSIIVTYSTKGNVKRNLKQAGFSIEKLPGPAGKREILRATKI